MTVYAFETEFGFKFGGAHVERVASMPDGSVCIRITGSGKQRIEVYVSPTGRSIRVFGKGEWKPVSA